MDIPTLLRVQKEIKEVQSVMCENENSHDLYELIKEVCQACDWEVEKLINQENSKNIVEKLRLSEAERLTTVLKILDNHDARLRHLENIHTFIKGQ
jgi:hypothetical protein